MKIEKIDKYDHELNKTFAVKSIDDQIKRSDLMKLKLQQIISNQNTKRDIMKQIKSQEIKVLSPDVIEKKLDKEIEINFRYFNQANKGE